MDSRLKDHFQNPRNVRKMPDADGSGSAGELECGAQIAIYLRFEGDHIGAASYEAFGSSAIIAAGSLLTEMITVMKWAEAAAVSKEIIENALMSDDSAQNAPEIKGELSGSSAGRIAQAADFAIEALHGALEDSLKRGNFPVAAPVDENHTIVAMSGGVDSTVACMLEKESGRRVTGVTMRLWSDPDCEIDEEGPSCCSQRAIREARSACHSLGLPHLTVDYKDEFESKVVDYFTDEYMAGRTPNPCTRCNGAFRFPALATLARKLGAAVLATGHYARIVEGEEGLTPARGSDPGKDQSYMLWGIKRELLGHIRFPLALMEKAETRRMARKAGLESHARPESQEVCFVPDDDYRRFLRSRTSRMPGGGDIIDSAGVRLGTHAGYINYTIGQRRGLGISSPEPLFVKKTLPEENIVMVGRRDELAITAITMHEINSFMTPERLMEENILVQVRYNSDPVECLLLSQTDHEWRLELKEPVFGVAPGQSAVLYLGDIIAAGGIIKETALR